MADACGRRSASVPNFFSEGCLEHRELDAFLLEFDAIAIALNGTMKAAKGTSMRAVQHWFELPELRRPTASPSWQDYARGPEKWPSSEHSRRDLRAPSTVVDGLWIWAENHVCIPVEGRDDAGGKWLVFAPVNEVDEWWRVVRRATEDGRLGEMAKVATAASSPLTRSPHERVICVYTYDADDLADVACVLQELRRLGFRRRLSYKSGADTLGRRYGCGTAQYVSPPGSRGFKALPPTEPHR